MCVIGIDWASMGQIGQMGLSICHRTCLEWRLANRQHPHEGGKPKTVSPMTSWALLARRLRHKPVAGSAPAATATPSEGNLPLGVRAVGGRFRQGQRNHTTPRRIAQTVPVIDSRLRTLQVASEHGTVTAAAQVLHYTPSAVSYQLRQLSADVGVELVVQQGRGIRLASAARTLLRHAERLQAQWEEAGPSWPPSAPSPRADHAVRILHCREPSATARCRRSAPRPSPSVGTHHRGRARPLLRPVALGGG
ncbi:LysR family transcriptional regulator [Streptomyces sp. NPDC005507]|uniref:LysR family transcriptional regulator n=1 Tax=Streptomyces sp. NPDC005507 TaxID=3154885 RepID=UPI0033A10F9B